MVANFLSPHIFMINGRGTTEEKGQRYSHAVREIIDITQCGIFAADCMVTWAKSASFFEDRAFVDAFGAALTKDPEHDAVLMSSVWRKHILCWAANHCLGVEGDYAELGCYNGDSVKIVTGYTNFKTVAKTYWLYDMFDNDGSVAEIRSLHSKTLYDQVVEKFKDFSNVRVIKGMVPQSFEQGRPARIALLHIDMNNAPSERASIEALYDSVTPGGFIIFDDYGWVQYRQQKDSIDAFMAARGKKVLDLPTGQGLVIK